MLSIKNTPHNPQYTRASNVSQQHETRCAICLEDFQHLAVGNGIARFSCGHLFCQYCTKSLQERSIETVRCPKCRFVIKVNPQASNLKGIEIHKNYDEAMKSLPLFCINNRCIATGTRDQINNEGPCPKLPIDTTNTKPTSNPTHNISKSRIFEECFPEIEADFNYWFSIENGFDDLVTFITSQKDNGIQYGEICCHANVLYQAKGDKIFVKYECFRISEHEIYKQYGKLDKNQVKETVFNMAKLEKIAFYLHRVGGCCNRYTEVHIHKLDYLTNKLVLIIDEQEVNFELNRYVDIKQEKFNFHKLKQDLGNKNFAKFMSDEQVTPTCTEGSITLVDEFGNETGMLLIARPHYGKYYGKQGFSAEGSCDPEEDETSKNRIDKLKDLSETILVDPDDIQRFRQEELDPQTVAELDRLQYTNF